jgi:aminopeptidase
MDASDLSRLAANFLTQANKLQPGEKLWLEYQGGGAKPLAMACEAEIRRMGGIPHVVDRGAVFENELLAAATDADLEKLGRDDLATMKEMAAYIRIRDIGDTPLLTASLEDQARLSAALRPVTDHRVSHTKWLVVQSPTETFAKACKMELPAFEKFYKDACLFDYSRMRKPAKILADVMTQARDVKITGRETDLTFSIAGIGAKECVGERNIPDGECYAAPVAGTTNGTVLFGPSEYLGKTFTRIYLEYSEGKIVKAVGGSERETVDLNTILDMDEGARRPGEFAIAFHPLISEPVGEILFDEKIRESWHMANGAAYKGKTDNGNRSRNHWDKVQIQRESRGGGEIWFDGRLIRKDGIFVVPELLALNPDRLSGPA